MTDFVADVRRGSPDYDKPMDMETALIDLNNFRAYGWKIPDGLTPELYMEIWNELLQNDEGSEM